MFPFYTLLMQLQNNRFHPFLKAPLHLILRRTRWRPRRCPHGPLTLYRVVGTCGMEQAYAGVSRRIRARVWRRAYMSHGTCAARARQHTERHDEQKRGVGRLCVSAYAYVYFCMIFTCDADGNHPLLREGWCGLATRLHICKYHTRWSQRED